MTAQYPMAMRPDGNVIAIRNEPSPPRLTWRASNGAYLTDKQAEGWITLTASPESE